MTEVAGRKSLPLFTVDAFASAPFTGNSAAVCLVADANKDISDECKQKIAMEMNIAETAFVEPAKPGDAFKDASEFNLRWFTPITEVNLCGHATMATATVIFRGMGNQATELRFNTLSGQLVAKRDGDLITLDLPLNPCTTDLPKGIDNLVKEALGDIQPVDIQHAPGANAELLLRLPDEGGRALLEGLKPATDKFIGHHNTGAINGVIVTVKANGEISDDGTSYDFFSRYFDPWTADSEDPVTGATHTVLSGYWSKILGKTNLFARQCSKRGGDIRIRMLENNRVELAGKAAIVFKGEINL